MQYYTSQYGNLAGGDGRVGRELAPGLVRQNWQSSAKKKKKANTTYKICCDRSVNLSHQTPKHFHSATTFPSLIYLCRTVAFFIISKSLSELNLYSSLYLFFFLKLPKILHKGKLCSLLYALSYEAKYPLIVDQRRLKNLEGNDKMWAIANLRGKLLLYSRKFRRPSRCLNQSCYFLFAILYSDQNESL